MAPTRKTSRREFFDAAVENARKIIDAVKPRRAKFCYEVMGWSLPDSPDSYLKMIKAVDRPAFGVHLDPCNLINSPEKFYDITAVLNECFDKLGPWIVSCHAKDLTWDVEMNVHFREVCIGTGAMDYRTYLRRLATLAGDVPLDDRAHERRRRVRPLPETPHEGGRPGRRLVRKLTRLPLGQHCVGAVVALPHHGGDRDGSSTAIATKIDCPSVSIGASPRRADAVGTRGW